MLISRTHTVFNLCLLACSAGNCGGGRCKVNETSPYTRICECEEGYYNLLNSTMYPCYRKCKNLNYLL